MASQGVASHKCLVLRVTRHRRADDVPMLAGDATRNVGGSTGSGKMGDELAHFKTARLCSITTALSNTMAVVINSISRLAVRTIVRPCRRNGHHDAHARLPV